MGPFSFALALKTEQHGENSERLVGRCGPWESWLSAIANPEGTSTSRVSRRPARQNGTKAIGTARCPRKERESKSRWHVWRWVTFLKPPERAFLELLCPIFRAAEIH